MSVVRDNNEKQRIFGIFAWQCQNSRLKTLYLINTTQFSMLRNILLQATRTSLGAVIRSYPAKRSLFSLASSRTRINQTVFASTTQCSNTLIFKRFKRLNFKKLKRAAVEVMSLFINIHKKSKKLFIEIIFNYTMNKLITK